RIEAIEIGPNGVKRSLSAWDVSNDQLRLTWREGLLSTGYFVVLPWQKWPSANRLRVAARLTLDDGHTFEADKDVTIRMAGRPQTAPARPRLVEPPVPVVPPDPTPLPKPRVIEEEFPAVPKPSDKQTRSPTGMIEPVRMRSSDNSVLLAKIL